RDGGRGARVKRKRKRKRGRTEPETARETTHGAEPTPLRTRRGRPLRVRRHLAQADIAAHAPRRGPHVRNHVRARPATPRPTVVAPRTTIVGRWRRTPSAAWRRPARPTKPPASWPACWRWSRCRSTRGT